MTNMSKTIVAEGRTTNEAIENGLKELNVSKDRVNVKVLESDDKRSFFSILAPRVVKVEMTLKEEIENKIYSPKIRKEINLSEEEQKIARNNLENFLSEFVKELPEGTEYEIETDNKNVYVNLKNQNLGFLIGYRGETLYAFQNILSSIASRGENQKVMVIFDIEGYKEKRQKTLEDLAEKIAKTVMRTKKPVTLEPMQPYERKIIHTKLQENTKIDTTSIGEEPYRKVVISIKRK